MADPASVHALCDDYVRDYVALDPNVATFLGEPGSDDRLTDHSPDAIAERTELGRRALRAVAATEPRDDAERIAKELFTERLGLESELADAGEDVGRLNVLDSPVQDLRQIFDLMPTETEQHWANIAARMAAVPEALRALRSGYEHAAAAGRVAALRQVRKVAGQCDVWAGVTAPESYFHGLAGRLPADAPRSLRGELLAGADAAAAGYAELAGYLRDELAPRAPLRDAVGAERYRLWSRQFTGARLDLDEAYDWAWQEFATIGAELAEVAARIRPGASPAEAAAALDEDPDQLVNGTGELRAWMQKLSDGALHELRDTHFTLPDELMRLECLIAPPGGVLGAYYTPPTDDFSRPGRMWWSVAPDQQRFPVWRDVTTVYHEGVPGHHLQLATATYHADRLNRFQRQLGFVAGHGEGWALYAERLMRELGYLTDDPALLGMLDSQMFRTCRVIVDIGMHLELRIPRGVDFHPGETWTPDLALEFLTSRTVTAHDYLVDEVDRYLGWPGQAPSYKLGERAWLAAREEARARAGSAFDPKRFHGRALELGPVGLDLLGEAVRAI